MLLTNKEKLEIHKTSKDGEERPKDVQNKTLLKNNKKKRKIKTPSWGQNNIQLKLSNQSGHLAIRAELRELQK